jgi:autotransporter-associated beta strand protein
MSGKLLSVQDRVCGRQTTWLLVGLFALVWLTSTVSETCAATVSQTPTFYRSGDAWSGGTISNRSFTKKFSIGLSGSASFGPGVTCVAGICGGAQATVSTTGSIGVSLNASFKNPTYSLKNPYAVMFNLPGSTTSAGTGFSLGMTSTATGTKLDTSFLAPSFGTDFVMTNIGASISGKACIAACVEGSKTLLGPFNNTTTLAGFNNPGGGTAPSLTVLGTNYPLAFPYNKKLASTVTVKIDNPNVSDSSTGNGSVTVNSLQDVIVVKPDVNKMLEKATGLPLNRSVSFLGLSLGYKTLWGEIAPSLGVDMDSSFTAGAITTVLRFNKPIGKWNAGHTAYTLVNSITLKNGTSLSDYFFLRPGETVTVTPTYSVSNGRFTNTTSATFHAPYSVKILEGSLSSVGSFGPVLSKSGDLSLASLSIASSNFAVSFGSKTGSTFKLKSDPDSCKAAGTVSSGFIFDPLCSGTLTKNTTGTVELFANNSYAGGTILQNGTLKIEKDANLGHASGSLTFDGGTLFTRKFVSSTTGITSSRAIVLNAGGGTFDTNKLNSTLSGVISGTGSFTKRSLGTLTLTGVSTYNGATNVTGGTLALSGMGSLSHLTALNVSGGRNFSISAANGNRAVGSLAGSGKILLGSRTLTSGGNDLNSVFSGVINGAGGLTKTGTGTQTLSGVNTYTGSTRFTGGAVSVSSDNNLGNGGGLVFDGGALRSTSSFTISRPTTLNVAGGAFDTATAGVTLTMNTSISGTGMLTKDGAGRLTLLDSNTYSGGTTVSSGTLLLSPTGSLNALGAMTVAAGTFDIASTAAGSTVGSLAGTGSVVLGSKTLTTGGNNADTLFSGVLSGTGTVTKIGAGAMNLAGLNTYTGMTNIDGGALKVNGALVGNLQNNRNGTLMGNGFIGGSVTNDGTIAPGNSIGTLNVGSYVSNVGSIYQTEVDGNGNNDLIAASGTATLLGGTVAVQAAGVSSDYNRRTSYNIVAANGGVTGTYDTVTSNVAGLTPFLLYDDQSLVQLTLMRNDVDFGTIAGARTDNQRAVAAVLTSASSLAFLGDLPEVLDLFVDDLTEDERRAALDVMGGQTTHTAVPMVALSLIESFQGAVGSRMNRLHQGNPSVAAKTDPLDGIKLVMAGDVTDLGPLGKQTEKDRSLWVHAYGVGGDVDADKNATGYDYDIQGFAFGADFPVLKGLNLGLTAGYGTADITSDLRDTADIDSTLVGVYGNYEHGRFYLDGILTYADNDYDTERDITFGTVTRTADGDYNGDEWAAAAEIGCVSTLGGFNIQPFLGTRYIRLDEDGFTEKAAGALSLKVESRTVHSWKLYPGIKVSRAMRTGHAGLFIPEVSLTWVEELRDENDTINASFVGEPAAGSFNVEGVQIDDSSLEVGAGFKVLDGDNLEVGLNFTAEYNSDRTAYNSELGLKYLW